MHKAVYGVQNADFWTTKADFGVRKQVSECENRYRSAKALPKASRRIFFAGPSGRIIFFPGNHSRKIFFAKSSCPPIKIKWSLPNQKNQQYRSSVIVGLRVRPRFSRNTAVTTGSRLMWSRRAWLQRFLKRNKFDQIKLNPYKEWIA